MIIMFQMFGRAQQKGSKRAIRNRLTGEPMVLEANKKARAWQAAISATAGGAYSGPLLQGPVFVSATFIFARIKSQYRTGKHAGELREDAPKYRTQAPDVDKLVRTLLDGMKGVVYADDAQVQLGPCIKLWGNQDATTVRIEIEDAVKLLIPIG